MILIGEVNVHKIYCKVDELRFLCLLASFAHRIVVCSSEYDQFFLSPHCRL